MPSPMNVVVLQRGFGRLERYSVHGCWTWRSWNKHRRRWASQPTGQRFVVDARRWVIKQAAVRQVAEDKSPIQPIQFEVVARAYFDARRNGMRCKRLRASSLRRIETALKSFERFLGPGYSATYLAEIDACLLDRFLVDQTPRLSTAVANSYLEVVTQVLEFAVKKELLSNNPAKKVARLYNNRRESDDSALKGWACPCAEKVRQIIQHATPTLDPTGVRVFNGSESGRPVYRGINQNDYAPLYSALAMTGLRIGEARFLTWEDIDWERKVLLVRPGLKNGVFWQPKTRQSIRRVPIVPELEAILRRLQKTSHRRIWVFETRRGTQLSTSHPTLCFRKICDSLGFSKRFVLHSLRKFWASTVAEQGMEPMLMIKALGHADLRLVMSTYYAQRDDDRLVSAASAIRFGVQAPI
ncbi:MAG TPA: tyrosine-type recombinase/integrase [Phycisphaerae bacterium]|nr:tyrosine-type recombinase/integrase [Phycisphaerae bacterium]